MSKINILDSATVDRIAAGEVVERPANVVKELVENAIDAGADSITVEIKEGGINLIRVTDNGCGIEDTEIKKAFMRHATSKIEHAEDLSRIESLGFRGEALSSIAAVCQVEMITKTRNSLCGIKVSCSGGMLAGPQEVGAPDGTTILVRNIFFNTPVRRKFLKTAMTEGGYIADIMQHIAMSKPDIAFKFINNGQTKFFTSGSGDLKEVIYRIYGKETQSELVYLCKETEGIRLEGYLGKPILNRSNRNFETVFVNGRYIKSPIVCKALEEGYKGYLMQHKYPFTVLHFTIDTELVDVNVHPTKMDIRILNQEPFLRFVSQAVHETLGQSELIPDLKEPEGKTRQEVKQEEKKLTSYVPEPFEKNRQSMQMAEDLNYHAKTEQSGMPNIEKASVYKVAAETKNTAVNPADTKQAEKKITGSLDTGKIEEKDGIEETFFSEEEEKVIDKMVSSPIFNRVFGTEKENATDLVNAKQTDNIIKKRDQIVIKEADQLAMFDDSIMNADLNDNYEILGQIFDTYWILAFHDKMYLVDQHAAHEKVKYERFVKRLHESQVLSQNLNPPVIISLDDREKEILLQYFSTFTDMGFEIEEFGGNDYALRAVPVDLYGCGEKELFLSVIDELLEFPVTKDANLVLDRIATMSCKAAVKGNTRLSFDEAEALMKELLSLDNPFQCPHGRPTIVSMSKYEIEKKFKRIL